MKRTVWTFIRMEVTEDDENHHDEATAPLPQTIKGKKKMSNKNLNTAKGPKPNDEFYTQYDDISEELKHYKEQEHFKGKVVFCNCDDPKEGEASNFWTYFFNNFSHLGLKRLISTHYDEEKLSYKLETTDGVNAVPTNLKPNDKFKSGDFRSPECVEILSGADIVVTNPPFSLFREYLAQLVEHKKKFLIIGSMNAITYKETFRLIKNNEIWLGCSNPKKFLQPDGSIKKFGNIGWFTNLEHKKRHDDIFLRGTYNAADYPKYDNYDAIEVSNTKDIPKDYEGIMGVPISFLDKYSPDQFEILGNLGSYAPDGYSLAGAIFIDGKKIFKRILIKNKKPLKEVD